jgi:hypothetical protein
MANGCRLLLRCCLLKRGSSRLLYRRAKKIPQSTSRARKFCALCAQQCSAWWMPLVCHRIMSSTHGIKVWAVNNKDRVYRFKPHSKSIRAAAGRAGLTRGINTPNSTAGLTRGTRTIWVELCSWRNAGPAPRHSYAYISLPTSPRRLLRSSG